MNHRYLVPAFAKIVLGLSTVFFSCNLENKEEEILKQAILRRATSSNEGEQLMANLYWKFEALRLGWQTLECLDGGFCHCKYFAADHCQVLLYQNIIFVASSMSTVLCKFASDESQSSKVNHFLRKLKKLVIVNGLTKFLGNVLHR